MADKSDGKELFRKAMTSKCDKCGTPNFGINICVKCFAKENNMREPNDAEMKVCMIGQYIWKCIMYIILININYVIIVLKEAEAQVEIFLQHCGINPKK